MRAKELVHRMHHEFMHDRIAIEDLYMQYEEERPQIPCHDCTD